VIGDGWFIAWFALVTWILHLTPTGSPVSSRWRLVAVVSTVLMLLWFGTTLFWPDPLEPPSAGVRSPWAVDGQVADVLRPARGVLGIASGIGFALGGASLLVRFHRAGDVERRQLRWLAVVVVPLPAFVVLAYYAASGHPLLLAVAVAGFMALLPIAAGLSISRYHLYDVDRILSRAVAWLLVSATLALTFTIVVVAVGRFLGQRGGDSSVPAVLGTLAATVLAAPAYRAFQEAADRRFDRRRYDAVRRVQAYVRDPDPSTTVEEVLREALHDPTLTVGYWVEDRGEWHGQDGSVVELSDDAIDVRRQGRLVARVDRDRDRVDEALAAAACAEATPELENAMLRARIGVQLAEVRESRARIAVAHLGERRRLERDLHDGAQQRLLAVAFQLRAAQVNGERDRLEESVAAAVDELQAAVLELRELANGLHRRRAAADHEHPLVDEVLRASQTCTPFQRARHRGYAAPGGGAHSAAVRGHLETVNGGARRCPEQRSTVTPDRGRSSRFKQEAGRSHPGEGRLPCRREHCSVFRPRVPLLRPPPHR